MEKEIEVGCARPTGGVIGGNEEGKPQKEEIRKEEKKMIQVGKPAPDFVAPAYHKGKFISVNSPLSWKWLFCAFIRVISHSSERQKYRRSPIKTMNLKNWVFKFYQLALTVLLSTRCGTKMNFQKWLKEEFHSRCFQMREERWAAFTESTARKQESKIAVGLLLIQMG